MTAKILILLTFLFFLAGCGTAPIKKPAQGDNLESQAGMILIRKMTRLSTFGSEGLWVYEWWKNTNTGNCYVLVYGIATGSANIILAPKEECNVPVG